MSSEDEYDISDHDDGGNSENSDNSDVSDDDNADDNGDESDNDSENDEDSENDNDNDNDVSSHNDGDDSEASGNEGSLEGGLEEEINGDDTPEETEQDEEGDNGEHREDCEEETNREGSEDEESSEFFELSEGSTEDVDDTRGHYTEPLEGQMGENFDHDETWVWPEECDNQFKASYHDGDSEASGDGGSLEGGPEGDIYGDDTPQETNQDEKADNGEDQVDENCEEETNCESREDEECSEYFELSEGREEDVDDIGRHYSTELLEGQMGENFDHDNTWVWLEECNNKFKAIYHDGENSQDYHSDSEESVDSLDSRVSYEEYYGLRSQTKDLDECTNVQTKGNHQAVGGSTIQDISSQTYTDFFPDKDESYFHTNSILQRPGILANKLLKTKEPGTRDVTALTAEEERPGKVRQKQLKSTKAPTIHPHSVLQCSSVLANKLLKAKEPGTTDATALTTEEDCLVKLRQKQLKSIKLPTRRVQHSIVHCRSIKAKKPGTTDATALTTEEERSVKQRQKQVKCIKTPTIHPHSIVQCRSIKAKEPGTADKTILTAAEELRQKKLKAIKTSFQEEKPKSKRSHGAISPQETKLSKTKPKTAKSQKEHHFCLFVGEIHELPTEREEPALEEVEHLGSGSFGQVFKMLKLEDGEVHFFAEKRMANTEVSARSEQEMLERVSHPHIIEYFKSYVRGDQFIILMEFADRGSLTQMVEAAAKDPGLQGLFQEATVWRFINHMASALDYLHTLKPHRILHRDLKVL